MTLKLICDYNRFAGNTITKVVQNNGDLLVIKFDSGEVAMINDDLSLMTSDDIMNFYGERVDFIHQYGFINDMEFDYINTVNDLAEAGFNVDDGELKHIYNVLKMKFEGR